MQVGLQLGSVCSCTKASVMTYLQLTPTDCSKSLSNCDTFMLYCSHLQSAFNCTLILKGRKADGWPLRKRFIKESRGRTCVIVVLK